MNDRGSHYLAWTAGALVLAGVFVFIGFRSIDARDPLPQSIVAAPTWPSWMLTPPASPQPTKDGPQEVVFLIPTDPPRVAPSSAPKTPTPHVPICPQPAGVACRWPPPAPSIVPPKTPTPYPTCLTPVPDAICVGRDEGSPAPTSTSFQEGMRHQ